MPIQNLQQYFLFFCKWKNCEVTGVSARGCDYCNLGDYTCRHTGEFCVAKSGLEQFAQSLADSSSIIPLDAFQKMKELVEREKRSKAYVEIAKLADHLFPKPKK
jgi:hypothetical protein